MLQQREVCQAFEKVPHLPTAGILSASSLYEELPVYLPLSDDADARNAIDMYTKYPVSVLVRHENPSEVRGRPLQLVGCDFR